MSPTCPVNAPFSYLHERGHVDLAVLQLRGHHVPQTANGFTPRRFNVVQLYAFFVFGEDLSIADMQVEQGLRQECRTGDKVSYKNYVRELTDDSTGTANMKLAAPKMKHPLQFKV
jgi:hypothetical protein